MLTVIQTFRDYYAASNKHDVPGMLSYYHEPVVRFSADARELERVGCTYLLHRTTTGWKIAVLAAHPADTILELDD